MKLKNKKHFIKNININNKHLFCNFFTYNTLTVFSYPIRMQFDTNAF